jgi:hypothetical protein
LPPNCTYYTVHHVGILCQAAWSTAGGPSDILPLNPSDDGCSSRNASGFPVGLEHQRPPLASGHSQAAYLPIPYGCGLVLRNAIEITQNIPITLILRKNLSLPLVCVFAQVCFWHGSVDGDTVSIRKEGEWSSLKLYYVHHVLCMNFSLASSTPLVTRPMPRKIHTI